MLHFSIWPPFCVFFFLIFEYLVYTRVESHMVPLSLFVLLMKDFFIIIIFISKNCIKKSTKRAQENTNRIHVKQAKRRKDGTKKYSLPHLMPNHSMKSIKCVYPPPIYILTHVEKLFRKQMKNCERISFFLVYHIPHIICYTTKVQTNSSK